jgi:hypothetical protein
MGPSAIDVELRSMSIDMGGSVDLMRKFLEFIFSNLIKTLSWQFHI